MNGLARRDAAAILSGLIVVLGVAMPAASATVTYSDLCRTPDSDDVAGHQVKIIWADGQPKVSFFWTDGQLRGPVAATQVRYSKPQSTFGFVAATPDGDATFEGRLTPQALTGDLKDSWEQKSQGVRLARLRHAKLPDCGPDSPR